jgi:flavorubredoxin
VGDVHDYPLFWPQHADRMVHYPVDAEIDLGSHTFRFVEAQIRDLPTSRWGYEVSEQVMFVADGFAYSHQPPLEDDDRPTHKLGECRLLATELAGEPGPEQIVWITRSALYWTRFVKMDRFLERFKATLAANPVKVVAPAHGLVIDDLDILTTIWSALDLAYSPDAGVKAAAALAVGGT